MRWDKGVSFLWESGGYPLPAFYFTVLLEGSNMDTSFQEVTGIGPEIETEDVVEGGENRFVHQLPKAVKHPKLVLKRGIAKMDSPLVGWCISILEGDLSAPIKTKELGVMLLNENGDPLRAWYFANAYPVHWEFDSFNSTKNEVAIETIELTYNYSNRIL